jgi:branched-chain amino acid transport system substrate-binding protein
VLQTLPGPFAEETGNGGIVSAQLAASDFETEYVRGDAEILPSTSATTLEAAVDQVRDWLDKEHVAAVLSSASNAVNQQIAKMVEKRNRTLLVAATVQSVNPKLCSPNIVVWGAGPAARARALALTLVPLGGKGWFLLTDRTPTELAEQAALHDAVSAAGGQVVGTLDHVVGESDLRNAVPKINRSNAQVIALAESEGDLVASLRNASLAGLSHAVTLAAPYAEITDIDNAGVTAAQGVVVATPYYWDTDETTRRFALRWMERMDGRHVTTNGAEVYAAALSFLRAAKEADDVDADKVLPRLRAGPIKGTPFGTVTVRPDGRAVYDVGVYRVMTANRIQARWAYYTKIKTIPGAQAFPPGACGQK